MAPGTGTGRLAVRRGAEFVALFVVLPVLFYAGLFGRHFFPVLLGVAALCFLLLWRDPAFDRRCLWNAAGAAAGLRPALPGLGLAALLMTAGILVFEPGAFLYLPRNRPVLWGLILLLYPLLSVYPQEVIYRAFFLHRYRVLFPSPALRVAACGIVFGLHHLGFRGYLAVALSTAGGLLFARTYLRTRSTLAAAVEHAVYGALIFTVGLGRYFYLGAAR